MREAGDCRFERKRAFGEVRIVHGPLGVNSPQGAVLFSGDVDRARQPGFSDPGGRRKIKRTLIDTHPLTGGGGPFEVRPTEWLGSHPYATIARTPAARLQKAPATFQASES